jgi:hypothetical protein
MWSWVPRDSDPRMTALARAQVGGLTVGRNITLNVNFENESRDGSEKSMRLV